MQRLKGNGFRVSLFCDPDAGEAAIEAAAETGADRVELYTGPYGACFDDVDAADRELAELARTASFCEGGGSWCQRGS